MQPIVSVLVPVYGVEKYIEKCSRSLFEQTYENIEYIFIDDCTKDNSMLVLENVLEEYPSRKGNVKIIKHKQNKGLSGARNTGIQFASGKYLMHLDSDDFLDLNVVECLVEEALQKKADIVVCNTKYVFKNRYHTVMQTVDPNPILYVKQLLTYKVSVCVWGKLYKSSLFKDYNIQFVEGLNFGEDYVTSPRVAYYAHKIAHCDNCFYNYVQYNDSSYTIAYKSKNIDDLLKAINLLYEFFENKKDFYLYKESLNIACISNKIKLLVAICLHKKSVGNRLAEICNLYREINIPNEQIPISYKVILWLADLRFYRLLFLYISSGYKLKRIIKSVVHS